MKPDDQDQYPKMYMYRRIVQAKLYMDINYAGEIDLDNISSEASFSKFHFVRLFSKAYGSTPHQYLTRVRIEHARKLLADGIPVTETCFFVGFNSPSPFAGLFKKAVGCSPSQDQLMQIQRKDEILANCE